MTIELSGVHFGPKSYAGFQNQTGAQDEFTWNHKYDFRPKLHDTKLKDHLLTSILKSQKFSRSGTGCFSRYKCSVDPVVKWFIGSCKCWFSFSSNLFGFFKQEVGCCIPQGTRRVLEQKWCDSRINRTDESQSEYKDHQWFQNECNEGRYPLSTLLSLLLFSRSCYCLRFKYLRWYKGWHSCISRWS